MASDRVAGSMTAHLAVVAIALVLSLLMLGSGAGGLDCAGAEAVVIGRATSVDDTSVTFEVVSLEAPHDGAYPDLPEDLAPGSLVEVGYPGRDGALLEVGGEYLFPVYGWPVSSSVPYESPECGGGTRDADGSFVADPPLWSEKGAMRLVPYLAAVAAALGVGVAVRRRFDARRAARRGKEMEARLADGDELALPGRP